MHFFKFNSSEDSTGTIFLNEKEAEKVIEAVTRLKNLDMNDSQIGVISLYNCQAELHRKKLDEVFLLRQGTLIRTT